MKFPIDHQAAHVSFEKIAIQNFSPKTILNLIQKFKCILLLTSHFVFTTSPVQSEILNTWYFQDYKR